MRLPLWKQVLRLLYKITGIEGGSTTLTTRFAVVNWLDAQEKAAVEGHANSGKGAGEADELRGLYRGLKGRIWRTCDQERVQVWSKGGVKELCQGQ